MHFETKAIHAGMQVDPSTGAIAPPIHLSTTFERDERGETPLGYSYIRDGNPTQSILEAALAAIDSGEASLAFASGMAAGAALLQTLPRGSRVMLADDCYYAYRELAAEYFPKWDLHLDVVAMEDADAVTVALRQRPALVWLESPSNPLMKIVDIAAVADVAHKAGAMVLVDGTFATPAVQRPIELGADIVLHATTKYIGGHSDVQGGALTFRKRDALYERTEKARLLIGGVASPFNSWLVLRGIRSLAARMRVHSENAAAIAESMARHRRIEAVYYPGLSSHPRHGVARRQMRGYGGMLSLLVRGGREEALAVTARVSLFTRATSLGGVESLIEHRASSEGPGSGTPQNLLRLSVGLEHPDDLIADLSSSLE
ncbi:MAG TPA: aminotransferase class I/II-fold pyridoxal phosphate-dependent enzyme [Thermoanaerobaculia bacterium]|nr:aminotransferase class I/II-fold pyridoxal phosphate-dependent enzyme [Thermoanaerobaculia bacterium]